MNKFKLSERTSVLKKEISQLDLKKELLREVGRVLSVGDGIARVYGIYTTPIKY
jgi:F0F1-type ATP synthase alpha subunit